jgi:hypothetical protein
MTQDNWPRHPDGRRKKMGELPIEQQREISREAVERLKPFLESPEFRDVVNAPIAFSDYTDTWFDRLAADAATIKEPTRRRMVTICYQSADSQHLAAMRELADTLHAEVSIPLVAHIDAIRAEQFAVEFARAYSRALFPGCGIDISATASLFSLVRQAIDYR